MSRTGSKDARLGLAVLLAAAAVVGLLIVAAGGPGWLTTSRTTVDVLFRDAQGLRTGQAVRVAGLNAGRVSAVDLADHEGQLRARIRLTVPSDLAARLKQDAIVTIQASLTGQNCVNIASLGESGVAWVPGQPLVGVESSLFDPILEQVGLGPVERGHLTHTIAEIRGLVDDTVPRMKKTLTALQQVSGDLQEATAAASPAVMSAARQLEAAAPKLDAALTRVQSVATQADEALKANRQAIDDSLASVRDITGQVNDLVATAGPKVGPIIDGASLTLKRADRLLYNADVTAMNANSILLQNRPEIDRTIANLRDTTDTARMVAQKILANPILISPLYKPSRDDQVAQANYDTAQQFLLAAREFTDALKRLEAIRQDPAMANQQGVLDNALQQALQIKDRLDPISRDLAEGVQAPSARGPGRPVGPR